MGAAPLPEAALREYETIWQNLLPSAWKTPTSLILFDYHVDNLLLVPDRAGIKACGILDFQDAVSGPITYDLMSLLEDARRVAVAALDRRGVSLDERGLERSLALARAGRLVGGPLGDAADRVELFARVASHQNVPPRYR